MLQIIQTDADQPYLTRQMGDNGEEVWRSSENYTGRIGARRAVELLAEEFGLIPDDWEQVDSHSALLHLIDADGKSLSINVDVLDERTGGDR